MQQYLCPPCLISHRLSGVTDCLQPQLYFGCYASYRRCAEPGRKSPDTRRWATTSKAPYYKLTGELNTLQLRPVGLIVFIQITFGGKCYIII